MLPDSTLGEGQFSVEAARDNQAYVRHLLRRVRQEFIEDKILVNQAHFAAEKLAREKAVQQARERYVVKAPTQGQLDQLCKKFSHSRR